MARKRGLIFHRTQKGKTSTRWTTVIDGRWIALDSLDAGEARAQALRLRAEMKARKVGGAAAAADAVNHQDEGARAPEGIPKYTGPSFPPESPPQDVPGTDGPGTPDGTVPVGGQPTAAGDAGKTGPAAGKTNGAGAGFAADINGAAADAQAKASAAAAAAEEDPIDAEDLEDFVDEIVGAAAGIAVEVQVRLQEWAWKRYAKIQVAQVPPTDESRAAGVKLWGKTFRRMLPKHIPIPDWVAAIAFVGMQTTKVQLGPGAHRVDQPPASAPPEQQAEYEAPAAAFRQAA